MKKSEVQIAETAEFPVVTEVFKQSQISVIASIDKFDHVQLVARRDRGIEKVSDLKGKKIGAAKGTLTEFFLGRFLELNGIAPEEVTIMYMAFAQSAEALASGSVDAFQVQGKDIAPIRERVGSSNIVVWPSQSGQVGYEVISGRNDWIARHLETVRRVLSSLVQAEEYIIRHPNEAKAIIGKLLKYDDAYMATIGPQHQYSLSLDQSLILAMEDEARWMIKNTLLLKSRLRISWTIYAKIASKRRRLER